MQQIHSRGRHNECLINKLCKGLDVFYDFQELFNCCSLIVRFQSFIAYSSNLTDVQCFWKQVSNTIPMNNPLHLTITTVLEGSIGICFFYLYRGAQEAHKNRSQETLLLKPDSTSCYTSESCWIHVFENNCFCNDEFDKINKTLLFTMDTASNDIKIWPNENSAFLERENCGRANRNKTPTTWSPIKVAKNQLSTIGGSLTTIHHKATNVQERVPCGTLTGRLRDHSDPFEFRPTPIHATPLETKLIHGIYCPSMALVLALLNHGL